MPIILVTFNNILSTKIIENDKHSCTLTEANSVRVCIYVKKFLGIEDD